jgi:lysophospholipid acyltransferase (LPLAT)-like uncharacterized protein
MFPWLIYIILRTLGATLRYRVVDEHDVIHGDKTPQFIFAFWHNRMLLMPVLYRRFVGRKPVAVLASASRDGDYSAGAQRWFGFTPVRGSTSRRGAQALLELIRLVKDGYNASITPDGPRGPLGTVSDGIIKLASLTGVPILPVSYTVEPCKRLNSWDRTIIPLPFAKCIARVGQPIYVPRDAEGEAFEQSRAAVQTALRSLSMDE